MIDQRDRLNAAIEALQGVHRKPPQSEKKPRKKRTFTPAQRKAQAKRMRAFWKAKKANA